MFNKRSRGRASTPGVQAHQEGGWTCLPSCMNLYCIPSGGGIYYYDITDNKDSSDAGGCDHRRSIGIDQVYDRPITLWM